MPEEIVPGAIYQHYSGEQYEIVGTSLYSEDPSQELVIYKQLYESTLQPHGTVLA